MALWTRNHNIPMKHLRNHYENNPINVSVVVGSDIWIFCDDYDKKDKKHSLKLFVFDTETCQTQQKDFKVPDEVKNFLYNVTSDKTDKLYFWWQDNNNGFVLYSLDRSNWEYSFIMDLTSEDIRYNTPIIGNLMYVVEETDTKFILLMIDLSEGKIVKRLKFKPNMDFRNFFLNVINDKLYITMGFWDFSRSTWVLENGDFKKLKNDWYGSSCQETEIVGDWFNGYMFVESHDEETLFLHFFNGSWHMMELSNFWKKTRFESLRCAVLIDNTIYCIMGYSTVTDNSIRVLEIHPKLTDICMMNLIDKLIVGHDEKEVEKTKMELAIPLREKWDLMWNWRRGRLIPGSFD